MAAPPRRHHHGTAAYSANHFLSPSARYSDDSPDMLIVYVPSPASEDLIVAMIYRTPNPRVSSLHTFLQRLQTIMVAARDAGGPIDDVVRC